MKWWPVFGEHRVAEVVWCVCVCVDEVDNTRDIW